MVEKYKLAYSFLTVTTNTSHEVKMTAPAIYTGAAGAIFAARNPANIGGPACAKA